MLASFALGRIPSLARPDFMIVRSFQFCTRLGCTL